MFNVLKWIFVVIGILYIAGQILFGSPWDQWDIFFTGVWGFNVGSYSYMIVRDE